MCIFANEGGPKSKSSRKETPLKIQKYKEKHVSGKNLEKKFRHRPLTMGNLKNWVKSSQL